MKQHPKIVARQEVAKIEADGYEFIKIETAKSSGVWELKHANGNSITIEWETIPFDHVVIVKNGKVVKFIQ